MQEALVHLSYEYWKTTKCQVTSNNGDQPRIKQKQDYCLVQLSNKGNSFQYILQFTLITNVSYRSVLSDYPGWGGNQQDWVWSRWSLTLERHNLPLENWDFRGPKWHLLEKQTLWKGGVSQMDKVLKRHLFDSNKPQYLHFTFHFLFLYDFMSFCFMF